MANDNSPGLGLLVLGFAAINTFLLPDPIPGIDEGILWMAGFGLLGVDALSP